MSYNEIARKSEARSRVESLYWAGVLIWAGMIFAIDSLGFLPLVGEADAWRWVFLGAGVYGTSLNLYYAFSANTIKPMGWDYLWSGFWLVVGLSGFFADDLIWAAAFLVAGVVTLAKVIVRDA